MDIRRQLSALRGFVPLVIGCAVVAGVLAYLVSGVLPKSYQAQTKLIVGQSMTAVNPDYTQLLASQRLSATYVELATTRPILTSVINELNLTDTPDLLQRRITAVSATDSTFLSITVTEPDPALAEKVANAVAAELVKAAPALQGQAAETQAFVSAELKATSDQIQATQDEIDSLTTETSRTPAQDARLALLQTQLTSLRASYVALLSFATNNVTNSVSIVEPAVAPIDAVAPRPLLNALLAALLGAVVALGIGVLVTMLDDHLRDPDEVQEALGLATLGTVPRMRTDSSRSVIYLMAMVLHPRSAASEAYRAIRSNVEFSSVDAPIRTLLVTSPRPGEGKTVTAANLAVAFAQAGRQVLLIDADLRKPGVHAMFAVQNTRGLSTLLLTTESSLGFVVQPSELANLSLLTTGPLPPNPAELLATQRMRSVLDKLQETYDLLVIDSPPLLAVTDAAVLSSRVDGTVLVLDAKSTRRDAARRSRDILAAAGARVLGVVLNRLASPESAGYGAYYEAAEASRSGPPAPPAAGTASPGTSG